MAVQNTMVQTIVVTSKHEDCNLMFTNHGKEDGIYSLKEIAKHKTKIRDLLYQHAQIPIIGLTFSTH
jgi:hypothetical protein